MKHRFNRRGLKRRYGRSAAGKSRWYNVRLNGKLIGEVNYTLNWPKKEDRLDYVRRSLIDHDGYDPAITVTEARK